MVDYHGTQIDKLVQAHCHWNNWDEIVAKNQLNYLKRYLSDLDSMNAKTIVFENQYVDRFFLEDYSEYYSRCFNRHPRKSARLHFFSMPFNEVEFVDAIADGTKNVSVYQEHYLGFVVLRPIPENVLGRACLAVYDRLVKPHDQYEHKLVTKKYNVSLYGMRLSVDSLAMQEQDKIVSACATSAIWTFFNSQEHLRGDALPSPSAITKTAQPVATGQGRTFPNDGLNLDQIANCLKKYKLEPSIFPVNAINEPDTLFDLKAFLKAMISSQTPVLLAGRVYISSQEGSSDDSKIAVKLLGEHLVCVTGIRRDLKAEIDPSQGVFLSSDMIDRVYIHDARHGPYQRIDMTPVELSIVDPVTKESEEIFGLHAHTGNNDSKDEYFVPDYYAVGLYHKIRISEQFARKALETFNGLLKWVDTANPSAEAIVGHCVWDIELVRGSEYKEEVRDSVSLAWVKSSFSEQKRDFLLNQLPRFIWRLRLMSADEATVHTDILIDATEIEVGQVMLGHVSFSDQAALLWDGLLSQIQDDEQRSFLYDVFQNSSSLSGFSIAKRFFANLKPPPILDIEYGPLRPNRRAYKDNERDEWQNIIRDEPVSKIRNPDEFAKLQQDHMFEVSDKYIWLIDHEGTMYIGKDCENSGSQQGHPTLNNGKPARIAGELKYCEAKKNWYINTWSAAYSQYLDTLDNGNDFRNEYIKNVLVNRFGKNNVFIYEGVALPKEEIKEWEVGLALDLNGKQGKYSDPSLNIGFKFNFKKDSFGNVVLIAKNLDEGLMCLFSGERKKIKRKISELASNEKFCKPVARIVWDGDI